MKKIGMLVGMSLAFGAFASDSESFLEAVAVDDIQQVKSLLAAGADVNGKHAGFAALHIVRSIAMVKVLLEAGAEVSVKNEATGHTPLHMAAVAPASDADVITALVEAGVDVNATDIGNMTALHYAAMTCNAEVTSTLIRAGAEVNLQANPSKEGGDPMTPLDMAAACIFRSEEAVKVISVLLNNGAEGKKFNKVVGDLEDSIRW